MFVMNSFSKVTELKSFNFDIIDMCTHDSDCALPLKCCETLFTNYCCDMGGHTQRLKRRHIRFPNITIPPLPQIPQPSPVPVPIPIPIDPF